MSYNECLDYVKRSENHMGFETDDWYNNQATYIKEALDDNRLTLIRAHSLSILWRNMTKLGCRYNKTVENNCWDNCPIKLKKIK